MHLVKSKRILILRRKYDTIPFLYFRGVYSAQDSFFSPAAEFLFVFPSWFFQQGREKNGKIYTELFISYYPPFFSFLHQGGEKNGKNVFSFLNFYLFIPKPHIFLFLLPFIRVNFADYTPGLELRLTHCHTQSISILLLLRYFST